VAGTPKKLVSGTSNDFHDSVPSWYTNLNCLKPVCTVCGVVIFHTRSWLCVD